MRETPDPAGSPHTAAVLNLGVVKRIPIILALTLLAAQIATIWVAPHFTTQDGPSHLYEAAILRELLFNHRQSIYSALFTIQRAVLPNWTSTILLALIGGVAGTALAERIFASIAIAVGFCAISYANRALAPDAAPFTPIAIFLMQTWFLWMGYYSFYLGMALLPFAIGYHARHTTRFEARNAAVLAATFVGLFFTHLVPAGLAALAVVSIAAWNAVWSRDSARWRELALVCGAATPLLILAAVYALRPHDAGLLASNAKWAWNQFPMQTFQTGVGSIGAQTTLRRLISGYIVIAGLSMKRSEWKSRGGLFLAAILAFVLYLFIPDAGLSGSGVKIRFAWGVFLLGGIAATNVTRLRWANAPLALVVTGLLVVNLVATAETAQNTSKAADEYLPIANLIPSGSSFVRMRYSTPNIPSRFHYAGIGRDPLLHLGAFVAAMRKSVDLSDYEAPARIFPIVYKDKFDRGQQSCLSGFESPDTHSQETLVWLQGNFPAAIDYVLVVGDVTSAEAIHEAMPEMLSYLSASRPLLGVSRDSLVRLYGRLTIH